MGVLPAELWIEIIRGLPRHYQRSCLFVDKLFHDIALQYVFARINVRLELPGDLYLAGGDADEWSPRDGQERPGADTAIHRSCELLRHIVRSPSGLVAQAVKQIYVYMDSPDGEVPSIEFMDALENALSVLRLRGFAWYGCHPMPRRQVFEALSTASCETMEDILLPMDLKLAGYTPGLMFPHLKSLSFLNRYAAYSYPALDKEDPHVNYMRQIVTAASSSLRSLGTFSGVLWKCSLQRFSALVELTLVLLTDIDSLGTTFTHFSRLRSLTLVVRAYPPDSDNLVILASIFRTHSNALPLLTVFRLSYYANMERDHAEAIATFLEKKPLLERLDIGYYNWYSPRFDDIQPVLEILQELPRLRALGYALSGRGDWDSSGLTRDHLLRLSQCIPHGLTALALCVLAQEPTTVAETDWIQLFRGLQSCRFIYVATNDHSSLCSHTLQSTLFDHPPPLAELVGMNDIFAWVEREPGTGRVACGKRWPMSKVYHRTAEEFGCEEWCWLLKAHVELGLEHDHALLNAPR